MSRISVTIEGDNWADVIAQMTNLVGPAPRVVERRVAEPVTIDEPPADLFPPFAEVPKYDPDERAQGTVQREAAPLCQHGIPMKRWPAGVNKAGKPFNASWRPSDKDCPTKPLWDRDAAA